MWEIKLKAFSHISLIIGLTAVFSAIIPLIQ